MKNTLDMNMPIPKPPRAAGERTVSVEVPPEEAQAILTYLAELRERREVLEAIAHTSAMAAASVMPVPAPAVPAVSAAKPKKKRSKWGLLFNMLYAAFLVAIVVGTPKVLSNVLETQYPMAAITSGSMWPALKTKDLIFIKGTAREELAVGDIIVYQNRTNNTFTIHRIVKMGETKLTTKGDANFTEDAPVAYEDVVGEALTWNGKPVRIPFLGTITISMSKFVQNANAQ